MNAEGSGPGVGKRVESRSRLRSTVYALVPLVVLFGGLEIALWLFGVGGGRWQPLSAGFDPRARYLVPDESAPGTWRTQIFDIERQGEEVVIPPKGDRLRVLLFGGSNTKGFPEDQLAGMLNELAPEPGYEVVNLGRDGYGSERVLILFEQAIELQPDVVVIYSGHNEFVETGFAMELAERGVTARVLRFLDRLQNLRTLNLLVTAFRPAGGAGVTTVPEARRDSRGRFRGLTYDQTLVFFDQYRTNLARMCELAIDHGARVVLCTVIGNMLYRPSNSRLPSSFATSEVRAFRDSLDSALGLVPARFSEVFTPSVKLRSNLWSSSGRAAESEARSPTDTRAYEPPTLRSLFGELAATPATDVGDLRSIEGAHWTAPSQWQPGLRLLIDAVGAFHERQLSEDEAFDLQRSTELLEELHGKFPDRARVTFYLALCTYLLGQDDERAVRLLIDAARYDRYPQRGNAVTNGIVRELAQSLDFRDVILLDAEAVFRARCPTGIIGWEVMMDVCHLHPGTRPVLMRDIAGAILRP